MQLPLEPWERIAWTPEQEQVIYRDWGVFYTHKQQLDIAAHYYDKSLELKADDDKALFCRSMCKRNIAQTQGALEDSLVAAQIDPTSAPINLEICDALYELNQFENAKVELHDNTRKFGGKKVAAFLNRLIVVDENFKDSIGDSLGPFILKNEKHFAAVLEEIERQNHVDTRPLWKILKEQEKCDVLSILEKEEIFLSPREIARRERGFRVLNQIYLNKSWIDVLFLKNLRDDQNLLLEQSKLSTPFLKNLTQTKYDVIKKFLKMIHARSPLYNEQMRKSPNKKVWDMHRENHLNRVQYQTHRNMWTMLRSVRTLRALGKIEKLSKYIEEVMGDYVVLKTHRIMPWKFEFINEVYNTLALAHADRYTIPEDIHESQEKYRMFRMLRMPTDKYKDRVVHFVFGDKSTYQEPNAVDHGLLAYKKFLARLEKRMRFARYSIEKCYLLHEIARSHLKQSRFEECCSVARKAVEECKNCNSYLWQFLSTLLICKAHSVLHKIERAKEALDEALVVAKKLNSHQLTVFIETCYQFNEEEIALKKRTQSSDQSLRKRRQSMGSQDSMKEYFGEEEEIQEKDENEQ